MRVAELMSTDLVVVRPEETLEGAIVLMDRHAIHHLLIVDHGRCVGVLSDRDLLETTGWSTRRARELPADSSIVRDVMSASLETTTPDDDVASACLSLVERRVGCLPVLAGDGRLVGILSERDLLRHYQRARREVGHDELLDPPLSRVMSRNPISLDAGHRVREAFDECRRDRVRHLCVTFDGWFVGLVSERDLRQCIGRGEAELRKLGDIMVKDVISLAPDSRLSQAVETMLLYRISAIPVLSARKLEGLVSSSNVLSRLARFLEGDATSSAHDASRAGPG